MEDMCEQCNASVSNVGHDSVSLRNDKWLCPTCEVAELERERDAAVADNAALLECLKDAIGLIELGDCNPKYQKRVFALDHPGAAWLEERDAAVNAIEVLRDIPGSVKGWMAARACWADDDDLEANEQGGWINRRRSVLEQYDNAVKNSRESLYGKA